MQLFDPNNPNEKKKMIAAAVLGVGAIAVLGYVFFGGGGSTKPATNTGMAKASPTPNKIIDKNQPVIEEDPSVYQPIVYNNTLPAVSEADRNIFSYYVPPPVIVKAPYVPTPTPVPPPPLNATSLT